LNVGAPNKIHPINLIKGRFLKKISVLKANLPIISVFSNWLVICPKIRNMNILQNSSNISCFVKKKIERDSYNILNVLGNFHSKL
jgi:hypothetical protein